MLRGLNLEAFLAIKFTYALSRIPTVASCVEMSEVSLTRQKGNPKYHRYETRYTPETITKKIFITPLLSNVRLNFLLSTILLSNLFIVATRLKNLSILNAELMVFDQSLTEIKTNQQK